MSRNRATPEKSTMASSLAWISRRRIPRIEPLRKMLSRPDSSGWKPVPTSSSVAICPLTVARPLVGRVMRARILSNVLLPAPLRPTRPSVSPGPSSKDTPFNAQKPCSRRSRRRPGLSTARVSRFPAALGSVVGWSAYHLDRSSTLSEARPAGSDVICEAGLGAGEVHQAGHAQDDRGHHWNQHDRTGRVRAEERPPEALEHAHHGVERIKSLVPLRNEVQLVEHRTREQADLHHERNDVLDVAVSHGKRRQPQPGAEHRRSGEKDD